MEFIIHSRNKHKINKRKPPLNSPTDQWAPLVSGTKQRKGATQPGAHAMARLAGAGEGARPAAVAARGALRDDATAAARWVPRARP